MVGLTLAATMVEAQHSSKYQTFSYVSMFEISIQGMSPKSDPANALSDLGSEKILLWRKTEFGPSVATNSYKNNNSTKFYLSTA